MFGENILIHETDMTKWYVNDMTKTIDGWLHTDTSAEQQGIDEISFISFKSYMCELASGKSYVIVDNEEGSIIHESSSFDGMGIFIDIMRFNQRCG